MRSVNFLLLILTFIVGGFPLYLYAEEVSNNRLLAPYPVKIPADNGFELNTHYFQSEKSKAGVVILHDCNDVIAPYLSLAQSFQRINIDALVMDMRGFGASTSENYSHKTIKQNSTDIVSYQQNFALLQTYWGDDVVKALEYLRKKLGKKPSISLVSSGCSAHTAVQAAEKVYVKSLIFIAPQMDYMAKEQYKNLVDVPNYFVGSVNQTGSFQVTRELFNWNGDSGSKAQFFKGSLRTNNAMGEQSSLFADMAQWVAFHSR